MTTTNILTIANARIQWQLDTHTNWPLHIYTPPPRHNK